MVEQQWMQERPGASATGWLAVLVVSMVAATGCLIPEKPTECATAEDCQDEYGSTSYCADDGVCEPFTEEEFLAPPCDYGTAGPAHEPSTRHIGVVMKLTEPDGDVLVEPVKRAIDLAINDFNAQRNIDGHKLAAIYCDNQGKDKRALEAGQHLADIGVEAVIGPGFSSHTLEVAPEVLIPNKMMAISPSATSTQITDLADDNLIWRTVPSDRIQGRALTELVRELKDRKEDGSFGGVYDGSTAKLGMSTRSGDAYASGLREAVVERLSSDILDGEKFFSTEHPNPGQSEGQLDYSEVANTLSTENPDVLMVWGIDEIWPVIRTAHDFAGAESLTSTVYLTADGGKKLAGAERTAEETETLDGRIWGTAPGTPDPERTESNAYKLFQFRWNNADFEGVDFGPAVQHAFISYAYDAVYLYGFASAAAGSFKGPDLAEAIPRVTDPDGKQIRANQSDIAAGITELQDGGNIEMLGATGPIKFDDKGDPTTANIELWCYRDDIHGVCMPGCTSDTDCGSGEVCRTGSCLESCDGKGDCPASAVCDGDICRTSCDSTNGTEECDSDEVCDNEICKPAARCGTDNDCGGDGEVCHEGLCRTGCQSDVDCEGSDVCQDGICRTRCESRNACRGDRVCEEIDLDKIVGAGNLLEAGEDDFQFQQCDYPDTNSSQ